MSADLEGRVQSDVMAMLLLHPRVAFAFVSHVGLFKTLKGGGFIRMGIPGQSDINGMLRDGRFYCIETKITGKKPTKIQTEYMDLVRDNGGVAGWATSVQEAMDILDEN